MFNDSIDFSNSQFHLIKNENNRYEDLIKFDETIFRGKVDFNNNYIQGIITFSNIKFSENSLLYFRNTAFIDDTIILFENINFKPFKTIFENIYNIPDEKELTTPIMIAFRNCDLKDVYFTNNVMSIFSFYKSTFDYAIFISAIWNHNREKLWFIPYKRRNIIFEDRYINYMEKIDRRESSIFKERYKLGDLKDLEEVAPLYRRFKVALDNTKDYEQAGWFYFNEYEMKRKACGEKIVNDTGKQRKNSWSKYLIYSLYKYFAGYGEKPLWSFYWFGFFTLFFAAINLFNGITFHGKKIFDYAFAFNSRGLSEFISLRWSSDYLLSIAFTISRIVPIGYLPIPKDQFIAATPAEYIISISNTIALLFFLTLIAIGLKRIFRRF